MKRTVIRGVMLGGLRIIRLNGVLFTFISSFMAHSSFAGCDPMGKFHPDGKMGEIEYSHAIDLMNAAKEDQEGFLNTKFDEHFDELFCKSYEPTAQGKDKFWYTYQRLPHEKSDSKEIKDLDPFFAKIRHNRKLINIGSGREDLRRRYIQKFFIRLKNGFPEGFPKLAGTHPEHAAALVEGYMRFGGDDLAKEISVLGELACQNDQNGKVIRDAKKLFQEGRKKRKENEIQFASFEVQKIIEVITDLKKKGYPDVCQIACDGTPGCGTGGRIEPKTSLQNVSGGPNCPRPSSPGPASQKLMNEFYDCAAITGALIGPPNTPSSNVFSARLYEYILTNSPQGSPQNSPRLESETKTKTQSSGGTPASGGSSPAFNGTPVSASEATTVVQDSGNNTPPSKSLPVSVSEAKTRIPPSGGSAPAAPPASNGNSSRLSTPRSGAKPMRYKDQK